MTRPDDTTGHPLSSDWFADRSKRMMAPLVAVPQNRQATEQRDVRREPEGRRSIVIDPTRPRDGIEESVCVLTRSGISFSDARSIR
jgi:hypothetical protein